MIKTAIAASAVILAALPVSALAQDELPRAYGALGYSQMDTEQAKLGAVNVLAGWKLLPYVGVEAEASFGVDDEAFDVSIDGVSGVIEHKYDVAAYAVGILPLGDKVELFARVGYGSTSVEASAPSVLVKGDGESLNYGAGASLFIDGRNGVRADWTRRDFTDNGGEADVWAVRYIRRF